MPILKFFGGSKGKQEKSPRDKTRYDDEDDVTSRSCQRRKGEGHRERRKSHKSKSKKLHEEEFDNYYDNPKSSSKASRQHYESRGRRETFSSKQRKKSKVLTESDIILTEQEISYMKYKNKNRRHRSNSLESRDTKQSKKSERRNEKGRSESRMKKHGKDDNSKSHRRKSKFVATRRTTNAEQDEKRPPSRYHKRSPSLQSSRNKKDDERTDKSKDERKRELQYGKDNKSKSHRRRSKSVASRRPNAEQDEKRPPSRYHKRSSSLQSSRNKKDDERMDKGKDERKRELQHGKDDNSKSSHRRRSKSVASRRPNAEQDEKRPPSRYHKRSPSLQSSRHRYDDERIDKGKDEGKQDYVRSVSRSRRRSKSMIKSDYRSAHAATTSNDHDGREKVTSQRSKSRQRRRSASWDGYIQERSEERSREELKRSALQIRSKGMNPVFEESSKERLPFNHPTYRNEVKQKQISNQDDNSKKAKDYGHCALSGDGLNESNRYNIDGSKKNKNKNGFINQTRSTLGVKSIVQRFNQTGIEETSTLVKNTRDGAGRLPKCALSKNVLSHIKSKRQDYEDTTSFENVKATNAPHHEDRKHLASASAVPRETPPNAMPLVGRDNVLKTNTESSVSQLNPLRHRWNCNTCGSANTPRGLFCMICGSKSRNGNEGIGDPQINHASPQINQHKSSDQTFAKPDMSLQTSPTNPRAWRCGSCGNVNENSRESCMNCGTEKVIQTQETNVMPIRLVVGTGEDVMVPSETSDSSHLRNPRTISGGNDARGHNVLSYSNSEAHATSFRGHGDANVAQTTPVFPKQYSNVYPQQQAWQNTAEPNDYQTTNSHPPPNPTSSWRCNFCNLVNNSSSGPFCCHCGQNKMTSKSLTFLKLQESPRHLDRNHSLSPKSNYSTYTPRNVIQETVWKCRCLYINNTTRNFCARCGANPVSTFNEIPVENKGFVAPLVGVQNITWECSSCLRLNGSQLRCCHFCGETKAATATCDNISVTSSISSIKSSSQQQVARLEEQSTKEWACTSCSSYNFMDRNFCNTCGAKRPVDDNYDLNNMGTANSMMGRRDGGDGYFNRGSKVMPGANAPYPSNSVQQYQSEAIVPNDGSFQQYQNNSNNLHDPQNSQQLDRRRETREQIHDGQNHENRHYGNKVHTAGTKQNDRHIGNKQETQYNNETISHKSQEKENNSRGPVTRLADEESRFMSKTNPSTTPTSSIPKSALSLSVLADISSGKVALKKAPKESKKEEATSLLSQIKKGKNLKSVKERMCDDRPTPKSNRPMTIMDQIKLGPKLKKVQKSNVNVSSREDENSSALGSILARRQILVGSKHDSARSEYDSEEWS